MSEIAEDLYTEVAEITESIGWPAGLGPRDSRRDRLVMSIDGARCLRVSVLKTVFSQTSEGLTHPLDAHLP